MCWNGFVGQLVHGARSGCEVQNEVQRLGAGSTMGTSQVPYHPAQQTYIIHSQKHSPLLDFQWL